MKLLNWNTTVKVKLTDLGKDIYFHQNDEFIKRGLKLTPRYPTEDEDGFCKFQLWEFMQLYGPHIGMCLPNVVEDINFYIEDNVIEEVSHVD